MTATDQERAARRIARTLMLAQSVGSAGLIVASTVAPLVGVRLAGSAAWAGVPAATYQGGAAAVAFVWGLLMDRFGRRPTLVLGAGMGVLGAALAAWSIAQHLLLGFLAGVAMMGTAYSALQLGRFVAAEVSPPARRGRAISTLGVGPISIRVGERADVVIAGLSTSNYLRVLDVRPVVGRGFTPDEEQRGGELVCLLSERLVRRWGLDGKVPGGTLIANGRPTVIVGVLPHAFRGTNYADRADIWFPVGQHDQVYAGGQLLAGDRAPFQLVARLNPAASRRSAAVEATTLVRQLERQDPAARNKVAVVIEPLLANGHIERLRFVVTCAPLTVAATLVLVMTIFNIAGLGMSEVIRRQREVSIRLALGASPGRVASERLRERLGIGLVAGLISPACAVGLLEVLGSVAMDPLFRELVASVSIADWRTLGFAVGVSILATFASGLGPAWSAGRTPILLVLQGGDWTRRRGGGARRGILIGQVVIVTVLALVGAAAARSLWSAAATSPGFGTRGLSMARVDPMAAGYEAPRAMEYARRLVEQLNVSDGDHQAALSRFMPINRSPVSVQMAVLSREGEAALPVGTVAHDEVTESYFHVVGIPVIVGRPFNHGDTEASSRVVIVNRAAASSWPWPNGRPIGSLVRIGRTDIPHVVVGVVGDVNSRGVLSPAEPFAYVPLFQRSDRSVFDHFGFMINLRSRGTPESASRLLRSAVKSLDPDVPAEAPRAIASVIMETLGFERMIGNLNLLFASLTLLVTSVGLYATVAHSAAERKREFGVRVALGARPKDLVRLVTSWSMVTVGTGLTIGVALGAVVALVIIRKEIAILSVDALVVGSVCTMILTVASFAICIPLWQVMGANPASTLRLPSETT